MEFDIVKSEINQEKFDGVSGRELHKNLELKWQYTEWIESQINTLNIKEGKDYTTYLLTYTSSNREYSKIDHLFPVDIAKHIILNSYTKTKEIIRGFQLYSKVYTK